MTTNYFQKKVLEHQHFWVLLAPLYYHNTILYALSNRPAFYPFYIVSYCCCRNILVNHYANVEANTLANIPGWHTQSGLCWMEACRSCRVSCKCETSRRMRCIPARFRVIFCSTSPGKSSEVDEVLSNVPHVPGGALANAGGSGKRPSIICSMTASLSSRFVMCLRRVSMWPCCRCVYADNANAAKHTNHIKRLPYEWSGCEGRWWPSFPPKACLSNIALTIYELNG